VIGFEEIPSINEAEQLVNYFVEVEKDKAPLPEGYVRLQDLFDCSVQDDQGKVLGKVIDILTYSPTKTLKVERPGNKAVLCSVR
jgi:ribosomal 30S subunit maturation factor RimM